MTTEQDAVNEVIREENAPRTLEDIAKEIQAVMVVNELLNRALHVSTEQVAEMKARIDEMIRIANQIEDETDHQAWHIVEQITDTGTHAERSMSILAGIRKIRTLVTNVRWDVNRIKQAAQGDNSDEHKDYDEVPF